MSIISRAMQDVRDLINHGGQEFRKALTHLELILQTVKNIKSELGEDVQKIVNVAREVIDASEKTVQKIEDAAHRCEMIVDATVGLKEISYVKDITHIFKGDPTRDCVLQFDGKFSPPSGEEMVPFLEVNGNKLDILPRPSTSTKLVYTIPWKHFIREEIQELPFILKIPRSPRTFVGWIIGRPVPKPFVYFPLLVSCPFSIGEIKIESSTPPVIEERKITTGDIKMDQRRTDITRVTPVTLNPTRGFQLLPQTIKLEKKIWSGRLKEERRGVHTTKATYCVEAKGKSGHAVWAISGRERGEITPRTPNPPENFALRWGQRITKELPLSHEPRITFTPFDGSRPESTNGPLEHRYITIVRNGDSLEILAKQPHEVNLGGD